MILLDANILLYAHVEELPQFPVVSKWLVDQLSRGGDAIALSWISVTAFLRISTSKRIFVTPWSGKEASERIDSLLNHPKVVIIGPSADHWRTFSILVAEFNLSGDIVMDAHIAAIAMENNASVASCDRDFRRFSDYVKIIDPLKA